MSVTLVQLETFARLATLGNYSRVAEELHMTQPGVTQQVRALERHFGLKLVDLVGRRPRLTEAGGFLAARAQELLTNAAALDREMREYARVAGGEFRLGATLTIGSYVLPTLLARFARRHPGVRVLVEVENTVAMADRLRAGAVSVALIEGPLGDPLLHAMPFQDDRLCLVVPPRHPLARRGGLAVRDLAGQPFVWREQGSGTRALAEAALAAAGVRPPVALELPSNEGVVRAVMAGLGIAILSTLAIDQAIVAGRLVAPEVAGLDFRRTFRLVTVRGRTLSPAAQAFTALVLGETAINTETRRHEGEMESL